jgi:hypothetical protein
LWFTQHNPGARPLGSISPLMGKGAFASQAALHVVQMVGHVI